MRELRTGHNDRLLREGCKIQVLSLAACGECRRMGRGWNEHVYFLSWKWMLY